MGRVSSSMPIVSSGASFPKCGGQLSYEGQDQLSCVRVIHINRDRGCGRATDADTMAPGDSTGPSDLCGPSGSMTLRCQHGLRCPPRLQASARLLVVTGAVDIYADPIFSRAWTQTWPTAAARARTSPWAMDGGAGCSDLHGTFGGSPDSQIPG